MATISEVHVDRVLTSISVQWRNPEYFADLFYPQIPAELRSDKYFVYKQEDTIGRGTLGYDGRPASLRAPGALAREDTMSMSTTSYLAEEYSRREFIADSTQQHADIPLDMAVDVTEQLTDRLLLDKEVYAASKLTDTHLYPATYSKTLVTGGSAVGDGFWSEYANPYSSPIYNFEQAALKVAKGVFRYPNKMLVTLEAAHILANHPLIVERYKYVSREGVSNINLPPLLAGMQTFVGITQKNSAKEGQTFAATSVWQTAASKTVCICWWDNPATAGVRSLHFGKTFSVPDQTTGIRGPHVRKYRDDPRKGWWIEVADTYDLRFVAVDSTGDTLAGYLLVDLVA